MDLLLNFISALGIAVFCFIAWLGSEDRRVVQWNVIIFGIGLQLLVGVVVFGGGSTFIAAANSVMDPILDASEAGARFLFGGPTSLLATDPNFTVGPGPAARWIARAVGNGYVAVPGDRLGPDNLNPGFTYILAFRALPQIIFFAALVGLLYRMNVIQPLIHIFAVIFQRTMKISGAESVSGAANIFLGIESAIAVKPFLPKMTRSELCAILTSCFGSIASSVLGLYAGFLRGSFPGIAGHLVSASILTIPACFVISKLLVPETGEPETMGGVPVEEVDESVKKPSYMDSLIVGALDGVKMAVGIAAVLIAILGVLELINAPFNQLSLWLGTSDDSLLGEFFSAPIRNLMGMLFLPLTFFTGVALDWQNLWTASLLIGQRLFETSIPPYLALNGLSQGGVITDRTLLIVSYVLCGFAHLASYGIFVGGLSSLVPERRSEISDLGFKALWGATLATLMTGSFAGLFFGLLGNPASIIGG